jgi:hypothetical protein
MHSHGFMFSPEQHFASRVVRVWSIQNAGCWDLFQNQGFLRADARRIPRNFRPAYQWLIAQMHQRIPGYSGGAPVWFWHSPKPDLRKRGHLPSGVQGVRIELELPFERVLLLDFEAWHCVLNRWHLSRSWRESREWDRKTKDFGPNWNPLPPPLGAELQSTWQRVFDFDLLKRAKMWGPIDRIQGVTEYVRLEEVRSVSLFKSR